MFPLPLARFSSSADLLVGDVLTFPLEPCGLRGKTGFILGIYTKWRDKS